MKMTSQDSDNVTADFPVRNLLPKRETGASSFLTKYPNYDGRGITIAIFDSGVDPGAAGLQITSDGKTKLIERFDCSGAGDVDTSTCLEAADGKLVGLTGRTLTIPKSWENPTQKYYIGVKKAFELYPKKLKERIKKKRKDTLWDPFHKLLIAESTKHLANLSAKDSNENNLSEILMKEDAAAQVEVLNKLETQYTDVGPIYDCIVFHNGNHWCACLDTSEKGDLASCTVLGEYSVTYDYTFLTAEDQLNYSVNVHENGKLLEIVSFCSPHGTHVASIAAANFPEEPERNGVAPGAQIISYCIGNGRLETLETGTSIVRAIIQVMRRCKQGKKVHIINMSYGEHSHWSNSGRIGDLMSEVVDKYGVVWVASAGNNGPALNTIGTPPNILNNNIIGVGAFVSPDMMEVDYSLRLKMPAMPFTWSSRGPTQDGDRGVTVTAPGAAITSVPTFTLSGSQLMNGTSMSAPNCSGCIALALSGLLSSKLPYTPFSVKRALENTALYLKDKDEFAQGFGLVQVEKLFDYLSLYHDEPESFVRFQIICGPGNEKGIFARCGVQDKPKNYNICIEPIFFNSDNIDPEKKIRFSMYLNLVCEAPWVFSPSHLAVMNHPRLINVKIDPTGLEPGVHNTRIRAYDSANERKGPVFTIEITVIQPTTLPLKPAKPELLYKNVEFKPETIKRHFILVPDEATWAVLRIRGVEVGKPGKFIVHCVQIQPRKSCKVLEFYKVICASQSENVLSFKVLGGLIVEVCIAKYWADIGSVFINYDLQFFGTKPDQPIVTMHHADGLHKVTLHGGLQSEEIMPSVELKHNVAVLRPTDSKIMPFLTDRDTIPTGRHIYQLVLTYSFHLNKATVVTLINGTLKNLLYESEFESQIWFIYDCNKQLVAVGDSYPSKFAKKLEKGDYTVKHQIRHEKKELLDKFQEIPLFLSQKLANVLNLDIYPSETQAFINGKKMTATVLPAGKTMMPVYISALSHDKLVKNISAGQYLQGTISFAKEEIGKKVDVYPFKYILTEPMKKLSKPSEKDKSKLEEYNEALQDLKTSWLSKLEGTDVEKLYKEIITEYPSHLGAHTAMLQSLESNSKLLFPGDSLYSDSSSAHCSTAAINKVLSISSSVIENINEVELLAYFGTKTDLSSDAMSTKSLMEKNRNILVEAKGKRGKAMCQFLLRNEEKGFPTDEESQSLKKLCSLDEIDALWLNIIKFVETPDAKNTFYFALWYAAVHKLYGRMMKMLLKLNAEKPNKDVDECMIWTSAQAGWDHVRNHISSAMPSRYPSNADQRLSNSRRIEAMTSIPCLKSENF